MSDQALVPTPPTSVQETELKRRRDIVAANIAVIGWSWAVLADKVGMPPQAVYQFKALKRDFPTEYIVWTGEIAAAVDAIPRPPLGAATPGPVEMPPQPLRVVAGDAPPSAQTGEEDAVAEYQTRVVVAAVRRYVAIGAAGDLSDIEKDAGRGAITAVLQDLGLLPAARELLRAEKPELFEAKPAAEEGIIGLRRVAA